MSKNRLLAILIILILVVICCSFMLTKSVEAPAPKLTPVPMATIKPTSSPKKVVIFKAKNAKEFIGTWKFSYVEYVISIKGKKEIAKLYGKDFSLYKEDEYGSLIVNDTKIEGIFGCLPTTSFDISNGNIGEIPSGATHPVPLNLIKSGEKYFLEATYFIANGTAKDTLEKYKYEIQKTNDGIVIFDTKSKNGLPAYHYVKTPW